MKTWKIPVSWEMMGFVNVEARSLEEAIDIAAKDNSIGLPEGDYVDGSWVANAENIDYVSEVYNDNRPDDYNMCLDVESIVRKLLNTMPDTLDIESPDYKKIFTLIKGLCSTEFPELHEAIFENDGIDLIFRDKRNPDWYILYYYNPDSNAGGQIVECPFNKEDALNMVDNEDCLDVLAGHVQYLYDVDSAFFFNCIFDMLEMKQTGLYLGNDVDTVCRGLSFDQVKEGLIDFSKLSEEVLEEYNIEVYDSYEAVFQMLYLDDDSRSIYDIVEILKDRGMKEVIDKEPYLYKCNDKYYRWVELDLVFELIKKHPEALNLDNTSTLNVDNLLKNASERSTETDITSKNIENEITK